jgi:hypothetical protein
MTLEEMTDHELRSRQIRIMEQLLEFAKRQTEALVRIAEALERMPEA